MTDAEIEKAAARIAAVKRGDEVVSSATEMDNMRTSLATEFGCRQGWTYRQYDRISPGDLSGRWTAPEDDPLVSNAYTFRHPDGSPAAIVGHVYGTAPNETCNVLTKRGETLALSVSFATNFPSWWYPGRTTLVVFEPAAANRRATA